MSHAPNRLSRESSPYLLQHAHNPVDWYPWGPEAFEAARTRDVPIFLSIGYATCYWCHVMERESFESADIAALMNQHFVCIKVDREERPDVDDVFMAATVMMSGHGGWPMSVFLEPQHLRPFWCGTYFPAAPMPGMGNRPTFPQVLSALSSAWKTQREEIIEQSQQLAEAVAHELGSPRPPAALNVGTIASAVQGLLKIFDRVNGGFSGSPKFPQPVFLELLLDVRERAGDDSTADAADEAIRRTLHAMSCGGLFDHVGGGFHRYSVDAQWTVPHFEKMLYDNAQLAAVYARAARFYGDRAFERTARSTLDFVLRSMSTKDATFFSAIDAEVNGREGLNYLWTGEEIEAVLGAEDGAFARRVYGLDQGPNFKDPHHPSEPASNVLRLADRPAQVASELQMSEETLFQRLDAISPRLLEARDRREQPRVDDKSVTAWSAMMIDAFSQAGAFLGDSNYTAYARRACDALWSVAFRDGGLARTWRDQRAGVPAVLEDYAALMQAMVRIARHDPASRDIAIDRARELWRQVQMRFMDGPSRLYDVEASRADLFVRTRSMHDGAVPSGTSVLLHVLLDLREMTGEESFADAAVAIFRSISGNVGAVPLGSAHALRALLRLLVTDEARASLLDQGNAPVSTPQTDDVLQVFSVGDLISIPADHPVQTTLRLNVREGWHIAAHDATELVPLRISIENGTGVEVFADYPSGVEYGVPSVGTTRVLQGVFELPIVLERKGEWTGTPVLVLHYQACTDTGCGLPERLELDVSLERA